MSALMCVVSIVETAAVVSVLPFLTMLTRPSAPPEGRFASALAWFGIPDEKALLAFGTLALSTLTVAAGIRSLGQHRLFRFTQRLQVDLSTRLLRNYIRQPYDFFLNTSSTYVTRTVLADIDSVVGNTVRPLIAASSAIVLLIALAIALVVADPEVAFWSCVGITFSYLVAYRGLRRLLLRAGGVGVGAHHLRHKATTDAFGAIKDIKILDVGDVFAGRYFDAATRYTRSKAFLALSTLLPRYLVELVAVGGLIALSLAFIAGGQASTDLLPVIGLYAFAAYRIIPAAQNIFGALTSLRFSEAAISEVAKNLSLSPEGLSSSSENADLQFGRALVFDNVSFTYADGTPALRDLSLRIRKGEFVAFVGPSGAGKSTLLDLTLGLLTPTDGEVLIDETVLDPHRLASWRQRIGYVPQDVFLTEATITENIAFGIPAEEIDHDAVRRAATMAQAAGFIDQLSTGFDTVVGERGARISGGQRQRIGIARALYRDPEVVVLDEATSALDPDTENLVMESLQTLQGKKTVLLVTHRLDLASRCDRVVVLDGGRLSDVGPYDELLQHNRVLQGLAAPQQQRIA